MNMVQQVVYAFGVMFLTLAFLTLVGIFGASLGEHGDVAMLILLPAAVTFILALFCTKES